MPRRPVDYDPPTTPVTYRGRPYRLHPINNHSLWRAAPIDEPQAASATLFLRTRWSAAAGTTRPYDCEPHQRGDGPTAQDALTDLAVKLRRNAREAAAEQILTPPAWQARKLRQHFRIGPTTRRHRADTDLHRAVCDHIFEDPQAWRPLLGAAQSWHCHIRGRRINDVTTAYVEGLTPWQFCALLAEMGDGGVFNTGPGERWYGELRRQLTAHDDPRQPFGWRVERPKRDPIVLPDGIWLT